MASKIFVNYRRDDVPDGAARVRDGLAAKFGKANVFMDVDNLLAGQRFDEELAKALSQCDVLIAVIGRRWMELLQARAGTGERDYVREEIAEALRRGLPRSNEQGAERKIIVIPVRVGREGQMPALPRREDLPEDIRDLVLYQKHDVAHERFGRDIAELIEAIQTVRRNNRPQYAAPRVPWSWVGTTAGVVAFAGWVGAYQAGLPVWWPWSPRPPALQPSQKDLEEAARASVLREQAEAKRKAEEDARRRDPVAALTPGSGQSARDCPECPEMVVVPAGSFTMGSNEYDNEKPPHTVRIAKPVAVGKFEVTFAEWEACAIGGGCHSNKTPNDQGWGRSRRPVFTVSWDDAKQYVAWLLKTTGKGYRLLTEAEWEYAARAGTTTKFAFGDDEGKLGEHAWYTANSGSKTQIVGQKKANAWGLHDMHGNVWEWVEDCWHGGYNGAPDNGSAWTTACTEGSRRVVRGGSWDVTPRFLRSAFRDGGLTDIRGCDQGLRVGRTLTP